MSAAISSALLRSRADAAALATHQLSLPTWASALAPSVGALQHCNREGAPPRERPLLLPSASSTFLALLSFFFFRSLRENQPAAEWKEAEEEEDDSEEEHFESVLQ